MCLSSVSPYANRLAYISCHGCLIPYISRDFANIYWGSSEGCSLNKLVMMMMVMMMIDDDDNDDDDDDDDDDNKSFVELKSFCKTNSGRQKQTTSLH